MQSSLPELWKKRRNKCFFGALLLLIGSISGFNMLSSDSALEFKSAVGTVSAILLIIAYRLISSSLRCPGCGKHTGHIFDRHCSQCGIKLR